MTPLMVLAFVVLTLVATPLFLVFGSTSMYLFNASEGSITSVAIDVFSEKFADSPTLVTIPLFTIAGYLLAESGAPRRLVELSRALLGWMPGGLAVVCLCASAFFTTFTGGSGITIVAIGGLLMPALVQERYPARFSLGLVTASGSLGLMFPPAVPLILYGIVANILIDKLFLAGILPGILTVAALSAYSAYCGKKSKVERTPFDLRIAARAIWMAKWELALPVVLIGGMATGLMRVHEASAFTALYVLMVECVVYREIGFRKDLPRIVRESMTLVGAILAILSTAIGFTSYMIQAEVPARLLASMETLITSKLMFLLVLNGFLLIVGMLMDIFAAIFVVVPLIIPIAAHFDVNMYHLGITFLLNLEIGYLTPPVGLNLFISSFRFDKPMVDVVRATLPFTGILLIALLVTTYVPFLSTYLPSLSSARDMSEEDLNAGGALPESDEVTVEAELPPDDLDEIPLDDLILPKAKAGTAPELHVDAPEQATETAGKGETSDGSRRGAARRHGTRSAKSRASVTKTPHQ